MNQLPSCLAWPRSKHKRRRGPPNVDLHVDVALRFILGGARLSLALAIRRACRLRSTGRSLRGELFRNGRRGMARAWSDLQRPPGRSEDNVLKPRYSLLFLLVYLKSSTGVYEPATVR